MEPNDKGVFRMILYRLAKWFEERGRLHRMIAEAADDARILRERKKQVEYRIMTEANRLIGPEKGEERPIAAWTLGEAKPESDMVDTRI